MGLQKKFDLMPASASTLGGVYADPASDADTTPCRLRNGKLYITPSGGGKPFVLEAATLAALGGIKAGPKTAADTVPVHIGKDQQLYVPAPTVPDMSHMQVVSYVGTGTYGQNNPSSISVDFPIKVVITLWPLRSNKLTFYVSRNSAGYAYYGSILAINTDTLSTDYQKGRGMETNLGNTSGNFGRISPDKHAIYWYSTYNETYQLNNLGDTFSFLVVG